MPERSQTHGGHDRVLLAHGGGGQLSEELIRKVILPRVSGNGQMPLYDAAQVAVGGRTLCMTTDSFVVQPLVFPGGDIGKLAVCGTLNDLAVAGAEPMALSLALIIEEGFETALLARIMESLGRTAAENRVQVVTGDTKTVEAGAADGLFINTTGIGWKRPGVELGFGRVQVGDQILLSGTIGDHGLTILSRRKDIGFQSPLVSDCACLGDLIAGLLDAGLAVKFMRDPTRGGLAATLNEIASATGLGIEVVQSQIPVSPAVQAAADLLGLDVLSVANEGKVVAVVAAEAAGRCLEVLRAHPLGAQASIIGHVVACRDVPLVEIRTQVGGRRIVPMPYGRDLPRIC